MLPARDADPSLATRMGYTGDIVARMTASQHTDIYADVTHLLNYFPHVHWQLDAVWSPIWTVPEFTAWACKDYTPGVKRLIDLWAAGIENETILGIVPFLGIAKRMLWGGEGLPCGAGTEAVTIATNGQIMACPVSSEFAWNIKGDFDEAKPVRIGEPCISCDIFHLCGGRCLFTYTERLWGTVGFEVLCALTRQLVEWLTAVLGTVQHAPPTVGRDLYYPPFNNSTEIIP